MRRAKRTPSKLSLYLSRLFGQPRSAMASCKRLIVGLGNPGADYVHTRHNIGFDVVDALAERVHAPPYEHDRGNTLVTTAKYRGYSFLIAKPLTYMNRSGNAVRILLNRYKLADEDLLVVYDDIALDVGKLRLRPKGSAGGHNGMQDIIDALGTDKFARLRFGVGSDFPRGGQVGYVLAPFSPEQLDGVEKAVPQAVDAILTFVRDGIVTAMNRHNS